MKVKFYTKPNGGISQLSTLTINVEVPAAKDQYNEGYSDVLLNGFLSEGVSSLTVKVKDGGELPKASIHQFNVQGGEAVEVSFIQCVKTVNYF